MMGAVKMLFVVICCVELAVCTSMAESDTDAASFDDSNLIPECTPAPLLSTPDTAECPFKATTPTTTCDVGCAASCTPCTRTESFSITSSITASLDDAEEMIWPRGGGTFRPGELYSSSSDLELANDAGYNANQTIGLRFTNLSLPACATITQAKIRFSVDEDSDDALSVSISMLNAMVAPPFSATGGLGAACLFQMAEAPKTSSSVLWTPASEEGDFVETPDFSSVMNEVVQNPCWDSMSNGSVVVFIDPVSYSEPGANREYESYDGAGDDEEIPQLMIEGTFCVPE